MLFNKMKLCKNCRHNGDICSYGRYGACDKYIQKMGKAYFFIILTIVVLIIIGYLNFWSLPTFVGE